jgi:hypothetical protein
MKKEFKFIRKLIQYTSKHGVHRNAKMKAINYENVSDNALSKMMA